MPLKFRLLGGGGVGVSWKGGGGSADFIFMGVGIFTIFDFPSFLSAGLRA